MINYFQGSPSRQGLSVGLGSLAIKSRGMFIAATPNVQRARFFSEAMHIFIICMYNSYIPPASAASHSMRSHQKPVLIQEMNLSYPPAAGVSRSRISKTTKRDHRSPLKFRHGRNSMRVLSHPILIFGWRWGIKGL